VEVSNIVFFDNVLEDPDTYVDKILEQSFVDVPAGPQVFKGIQLVKNTYVADRLQDFFPNTEVIHDFVRMSPENQEEPNYIHSDKKMCDVIAILYLNKDFPVYAGTDIYENKKTGSCIDTGKKQNWSAKNFNRSIHVSMKYNRMIAFPADLYHSRSIKENFGEDLNSSRLVQVIFLKRV
jgi:hypothetical protein